MTYSSEKNLSSDLQMVMSCEIDDLEIYNLKICIFQSNTKSQKNYEVFYRFTSNKYMDTLLIWRDTLKGHKEIN